MSDEGRYDDIIGLPHHKSERFPQMSLRQRAAQFSPFAALKGYEEELEETKRVTDERRERDESAIDDLNAKLLLLKETKPQVRLTYFETDKRKPGGVYRTVTERVKKLEPYEEKLTLESGKVIFFGEIIEIEIL